MTDVTVIEEDGGYTRYPDISTGDEMRCVIELARQRKARVFVELVRETARGNVQETNANAERT